MSKLRSALLAGLACWVVAEAGRVMPASHVSRARHRGAGVSPAPVSAAEALSIAWELPVPDTPAPFVIGMGERFVIATRAGRISAHPATGGPAIWEGSLAGSLSVPPVSIASRLAVSLDDGWLVLLDSESGREVARRRIGEARAILSAASAGLLAAEPAGSLTLLDPADGSERWRAPLPAAPSAAASQCSDAILVGTAGGTLVGLSATDGTPRWKKKLGGAITTPALCSGRDAWVGSADNRIYALKVRRRSCHVAWSYLTGGDVAGRPQLYGRRLLVSSYDTYLYAFEADNGHLAWKVRLSRRPQPDNLVWGDLLFVAPLNTERLEAFRLPAGTQAGSLTLPAGRFVTPPAIAGATVAIGSARYGEETARVLGLVRGASGTGADGTPSAASSPP